MKKNSIAYVFCMFILLLFATPMQSYSQIDIHKDIIRTQDGSFWSYTGVYATQNKANFDKAAGYIGGDDSLFRYITTAFKYPFLAAQEGIGGTVSVLLKFNKKGIIKQVIPIKDNTQAELHTQFISYGIYDELTRILKQSKNWEPAIKKGKRKKFTASIMLHLIPPGFLNWEE